MTKKILVPGAGLGQEPVIRKAKDLGLHVIVVSPEGDYPGLKYADKHYIEDVKNKEQVLHIAQKENIDGIVSDQNDIPVETMGYVVDHLNLTGNSYETSKLFSRKHLMRKKCAEINVPTIQYQAIDNINDAYSAAEQIGYPLVCKPIDNQSSKGISKVDTANEMEIAFNNAILSSFSKKVILEKFIAGTEFCVEGLAINKDYKNLLLLERTYFKNTHVFVPSMVTSPVSLPIEKQNELLDLNYKICTEFGIKNGLTHAEYLLNPEDERFYLVEVAARGGGVFISSHLISHACGFDTSEMLVRLALGDNLDLIDYHYAEKAVRYICFYLKSGSLQKISGINKIKDLKNVIMFYDANLKLGQVFEGLKDKSSRLGPILLGGKSIENIHSTTEKIHNLFFVETNDSTNKIIWE